MSDQHIRGWRKRTTAQAREALQRLIDGCWHATSERKAKACFTIPVNEERDADCIVSDVIIERDRLERERAEDRAAIQALAASIPWLITIVRSTAPAVWSGWSVVAQIENRLKEYAAAIARATGQEGAR